MKLYTEEQVKEAYLEGWNDGKHDNIGYIDRVIESLTPIELPSDEEIEEASPRLVQGVNDYYVGHKGGFIDGADWMKEQILNQNK